MCDTISAIPGKWAEPPLENARQSERDFLTGLRNRNAFLRDAAPLLLQDAGGYALLLINLDAFQGYNAAFGHLAGDRLLQKIAVALCVAFDRRALVARIGGDDFAILLPYMAQEKSAAAQLVAAFKAVRICMEQEEQPARPVTLSVGAAEFPADAVDMTALFVAAQLALAAAKAAGKDKILWYSAVR